MKLSLPATLLALLVTTAYAELPACAVAPPKGMWPEACIPPWGCNYCYLTMNELKEAPCKAVTWIFARGTTELGNMGATIGTLIAMRLNETFGGNNLAVQGVDYQADLFGMLAEGGCSEIGIEEAKNLFEMVGSKCPNSVVLAGGYSQGAACMHRALPLVTQKIRDQVAAVVLFGDSQYAQENKTLVSIPPTKYKIFCNPNDYVCNGQLMITNSHFLYSEFVPDAVGFLETAVRAVKGKTFGSGTSSKRVRREIGDRERAK